MLLLLYKNCSRITHVYVYIYGCILKYLLSSYLRIDWLFVWKSLLPPYTACVFGMCDSNMSPPCLSHSVSSANTPAGLYDSIPVIFSQGVTLDSGKQRCLLLRPAYQMALKDKIIFTKKQTSDSHVSHSFIVCPWVLIVQRRETSIRQACVWCFLMWDLDVRRWIVKF